MIEFWHQRKNVILVQRDYQAHFQVSKPPQRKTIVRIVCKFEIDKCIGDLLKRNGGISKLGKTEDNVESIGESITKSRR